MQIRPFKALHPRDSMLAQNFCTPPYDIVCDEYVLNAQKKFDDTYFQVTMPQVLNPHEKNPQKLSRLALDRFKQKGLLIKDESPCLYIYEESKGDFTQTGVVATLSSEDYRLGKIKANEHTLPKKVAERVENFYQAKAHTEPVFLFHKDNRNLQKCIQEYKKELRPDLDFVDYDGYTQRLWIISKTQEQGKLIEAYEDIEHLYIADGHHRTAASAMVSQKVKEDKDRLKDDEVNYFMAAIFQESQLKVLPYNRVIANVKLTEWEILKKLQENFDVEVSTFEFPTKPQTYTMKIFGESYLVKAKGKVIGHDAVKNLDVSILQKYVIEKIFGIDNPTTNPNIYFVGGHDSIEKIEKDEKADVSILMYPTSTSDIIKVSDMGQYMPPKSTYFMPKLISGLFIHEF